MSKYTSYCGRAAIDHPVTPAPLYSVQSVGAFPRCSFSSRANHRLPTTSDRYSPDPTGIRPTRQYHYPMEVELRPRLRLQPSGVHPYRCPGCLPGPQKLPFFPRLVHKTPNQSAPTLWRFGNALLAASFRELIPMIFHGSFAPKPIDLLSHTYQALRQLRLHRHQTEYRRQKCLLDTSQMP